MRLWQWFLFVGSLFLLHWGLRNLWCHYSQKVKRTLRRALLALVLLAGLAVTARAGSLYVSTTGGGSDPCSLAQPCSLAHAQTVAQGLIATGLTEPLYVWIRAGTYTLSTGLTFGAADSGTSSLGVYYFTITPTANSNNDLFYDLSLAPAGFWSHVRSDGGDIRVTKQDGTTQVPREVSAFNSTAHTGALYVGTASGTATAYRVYYGSGLPEPSTTSAYGRNSVWPSPAKGIWHMEDVATPAVDSTGQNNLTIAGSETFSATGRVEKAIRDFTGGHAVSSGAILSTDIYSMSTWVNFTAIDSGTPQYFFSRGNGTDGVIDKVGIYSNAFLIFNGATVLNGSGAAPTTGVWYHIVFLRNGSAVKLYVNDTKIIDTTETITYTTGNIMFGCTIETDGAGEALNGTLDEARLWDNYNLTSTEITTLYANQNAPGSFWTTGSEIVTPMFVNAVTWQAYPGEVPVISGGQTVTGWSLYSGSIYRANVGTSWDFRQIYVNGVHAQRAKGALNPQGWTRTETGYTAPDSSMASWGNPTDIEIVNLGPWSMDRCKVVSITDTAITMSSPCWTNQQDVLSAYGVRATPSWVENAYELLASGYWYLNRTTGYLYYWPPSGNMIGVTVVAPVVDNLLTVSGASNIQFGTVANPLVFAYSNWIDPDSTTGYVGLQNGYTWTATPDFVATHGTILDAAVTVNASDNISFVGDQFSHLGSRGILLNGGNANMTIANNRFADNAAGLLQIGDVNTCNSTQESNITVTANKISTGNEFEYLDNGGIFAACGTGVQIANNEIDQTPWVPIAGGWGWSTTPYLTNSAITGNYINGACIGPAPLGWDCGSIYTNGPQSVSDTYATGLLVAGNYSSHAYPIGLYADSGSAWETWRDNVFQNVYNDWFQIGIGINNMSLVNNFTDNAAVYNTGTNITVSGTVPITSGTQSFGTPQQAIICAAGVPGSTACTTPTLWPTWQSGVGATWTRAQMGP